MLSAWRALKDSRRFRLASDSPSLRGGARDTLLSEADGFHLATLLGHDDVTFLLGGWEFSWVC